MAEDTDSMSLEEGVLRGVNQKKVNKNKPNDRLLENFELHHLARKQLNFRMVLGIPS